MKEKWNITVDENVKAEFIKIAEKLGIKPSPWIESKMKEFIKEYEKNKITKGPWKKI